MHKLKFYHTISGREVVLEFIRSLAAPGPEGDRRRSPEAAFGKCEAPCLLNERRASSSSIKAAKGALAVVHAFIKKARKTPEPDLKLAATRKREFEL